MLPMFWQLIYSLVIKTEITGSNKLSEDIFFTMSALVYIGCHVYATKPIKVVKQYDISSIGTSTKIAIH